MVDLQTITIHTEYIKLNQFLKWINVAASGAEANQMIRDGKVKVDGQIELRRGRKLYPGNCIKIEGDGLYSITREGSAQIASKGIDAE
jgi:ribosome-associated protein